VTRFRLLVSEAMRSIGANKSTTLATAATVLVGMFLLGVFVGLGTWLVSWSDAKKKELVVHVFLTDAATPKQVNAIGRFLEADQRVKPGGINFISKDEALAIAKKRFPDLTSNLASNPLPRSFDVTPRRGEDTGNIALAVKGAKLPGVDEVRWGKEVSQRILQIARAIQIVFLVATLILLVASTIDIANTIRLSIFARRREVEVMKLVGATNWFVRGPFMLEGLLTGALGALAAIVLLFLSRQMAAPAIVGHIENDPGVHAMPFAWTSMILIAVGLGIGALGSGLTLRRFLKI
jgi:cell division transport system permease protein